MIGSFTLIDLGILVLMWFITSMIANLIWTRFVVLRYVGRAVMSWLDGIENDPKGQETLGKLANFFFVWMGAAKINTGKKIKVPAGEVDGKPTFDEVDEIVTPVDLLARTIGNYAFNKIRGSSGGVKAQLHNAINESMAESGVGLSPAALTALAKGKLGPALAEVALPELLKRLNKGQGDTSSGGGKW